ncbi:MAG: redox-regulated ATPase YchF [Elusimicrobiota bacterium]|nr:redox-regulated ATPase YchF [Endomicrobiia bacterium]MDW8165265.1 redox-regulated ATPase YchF [Elusimicrobiota bacterium]
MEIGIIGLPNVGKSTVFSLLTRISVGIDKFPFTTIDPNVGVVEVADERLDFLAEVLKPKKKTYAFIKFVDIAGLIKGASKGEGLGNRFLSNIRSVDGIVHVLRIFSDSTVASSINKIDPIEEIKIINSELLLSDIQILESYLEKILPKANSGDKRSKQNLEIVKKIEEKINFSINLKEIKNFIFENLKDVDKELFYLINTLLCVKDVIYLLNYDEMIERNHLLETKQKVEEFTGSKVLLLNAKFEMNLLEFPIEEQKKLREEYKIPDDEIKNFIKESVGVLNLVTFYTIVGEEFRSWFIKKNSTVLDAAGKIHTDMKEGFINAEVVNFNDFKECPDFKVLHKNGLIKIVGKDYVVKDGDIIKINFRKT